MSATGPRGSRQPASRPNLACHSGVPGVRAPTSFFFHPGHPTSAAFERSREAGTARPLISSTSVSVWKWNCVFTHARTLAGTYSSQIAGGSTMWLSQWKIGKGLAVLAPPPWRSHRQRWFSGRRVDAEGVERTGDHRVVADGRGEIDEPLEPEALLQRGECLVADPVLPQQTIGVGEHLRLRWRQPGRRPALADGGDDLVADAGLVGRYRVGGPLVLGIKHARPRDDGQLALGLCQRPLEADVVARLGDAPRQLGAGQQRGDPPCPAPAALGHPIPPG